MKLPLSRQTFKRFALPYRPIVLDVAANLGGQNEETAIDIAALAVRLLLEILHKRSDDLKLTKPLRRIYGRHCRQAAMASMKLERRGNVHVRHAIAIGHAKLIVIEVTHHAFESSPRAMPLPAALLSARARH